MAKKKSGFTYVSILTMLFLALILSELIFQNVSNLNRINGIIGKKDLVFSQCKALVQDNTYKFEEGEYSFYRDGISYNIVCTLNGALIKVSVSAMEDDKKIEELVRYRFIGNPDEDEATGI